MHIPLEVGIFEQWLLIMLISEWFRTGYQPRYSSRGGLSQILQQNLECNKICVVEVRPDFCASCATKGSIRSKEVNRPRSDRIVQPTGDESLVEKWILHKLNIAATELNKLLAERSFMLATTAIYNFWLYELCDVYIVSASFSS